MITLHPHACLNLCCAECTAGWDPSKVHDRGQTLEGVALPRKGCLSVLPTACTISCCARVRA